MGYIRPKKIPFVLAMFLVKKNDGTMWMYIGYKALNKKTTKSRYPILQINKLIVELHGACYFTKIDLSSLIDWDEV